MVRVYSTNGHHETYRPIAFERGLVSPPRKQLPGGPCFGLNRVWAVSGAGESPAGGEELAGFAVLRRPWKSQARSAFQRRRWLNHSYLRGDYSVPSDGHAGISGIYRRFRPSLSERVCNTNRPDSQPD